MQAQRGEDGGGVQEHRHVRGRGVEQALRHEQEFSREQQADDQAGQGGAVAECVQALGPPHHHRQHQRRERRAQADLHDWRDIAGYQLDGDLLETPADAQGQHAAGCQRVQRQALGLGGGRAHGSSAG
ncbi:hypothetical protein G6F68_018243 [Rhizopus microsporus]|nr:hypothetical protein G6F68_018243 [Rhizopus microsporus]